jgi:hypothetical protein
MSDNSIYSENDGRIGFWIKDEVYTPVYPREGRNYLNQNKLFDRLSKCKNVGKFFKKGNSNKNGFYANGRHCYRNVKYNYKLDDDDPSQIENDIVYPDLENSYQLCLDMEPFNNITINLASLICSHLGDEDRTWPEIFEDIKTCDLHSDCYNCTTVGHKIASSLIRIAAMRIFAEPEQSILELPVNSIDSYDPESRVGKFGMGFFSFLYWIVKHPKRRLLIYSWFKDDDKYCGYCATLRDSDDGLTLNLRILETSVTKTGTFIHLDASEDNFDPKTLENFKEQLQKLEYMPNENIGIFNSGTASNHPTDLKSWNCINGKNSAYYRDAVFIFAGRNFISIEDYAGGIPLKVLLGSLFIPSISTKTIRNVAPKSISLKSKKTEYNSKFSIAVGGVVVVRIKSWGSFLIGMPSTTRLPVSRDDILLDEITAPIFIEECEKVLSEYIKDKNINTFVEDLEKYKLYTSSKFNKTIIDYILGNLFEKYKDVLIDKKYYLGVNNVVRGLISSPIYSIPDLEKYILSKTKYKTDIWEGKYVIILNRKSQYDISSFGFSRLIFVNKDYINNPNWIQNGGLAFPQLKLVPISQTTNIEKYTKLIPNIGEKSIKKDTGKTIKKDTGKTIKKDTGKGKTIKKDTGKGKTIKKDTGKGKTTKDDNTLYDLYYNMISRFDGLKVYFNMTFTNINSVIRYIKRFNDIHEKEDILYALINKFNSFEGSKEYGVGKFNLNVNIGGYGNDNPFNSGEFLNVFGHIDDILLVKIKDFILQITISEILYTSREQKYTNLNINTILNPYYLIYKFDKISTEKRLEIFRLAYNHKNYIFFVFSLIQAVSKIDDDIDIDNEQFRFMTNIIMRKIEDFHFGDELYKNIFIYYRMPNAYELEPLRKISDEITEWLLYFMELNIAEDDEESKEGTLGSILGDIPGNIKEWFLSNEENELADYDSALYKTSQLIGYLFANEKSDDLIDTYRGASQYEGSVGLQMAEIAINEGTSKDFISATLTELVQNSFDAIRMTGIDDKEINISFEIVGERFHMTVEDFVGIPPIGFLYMGVPFLSTKGDNELATGEMGSGFFNVYRESEYVIIDTTFDGMRYISYERPIIGDLGRVIDVSRKVIVMDSEEDNYHGTKITVISQKSSEEKLMNFMGNARYHSIRILSQISAFNETKININGKLYSLEKEYVASIGYFDIYFTDGKNISYIFTNGVPFAPLDTYYADFDTKVRSIANSGVIINIRYGGYTPVQSRTRINLPDDILNQFNNMKYFIVFVRLLKLFNNDPDTWKYIYPNYGSKSEANQLKLKTGYILRGNSWEDRDNILVYLMHMNTTIWKKDQLTDSEFSTNNTLSKYTNDIIDYLGDRFMDVEETQEDIKQFIDRLELTPFPYVQNQIKTILYNWIKTKNPYKESPIPQKKSPSKKSPSKSSTSEEEIIISKSQLKFEEDEDDEELQPYFEIWLETFIDIAVAEEITSWTDSNVEIIRVLKSDKMRHAAGYYRHDDKSININTIHWTPTQRKSFMNSIKNVKNPYDFAEINDTKYQQFMGYSFPASTCPHELEHARRRVLHTNDQGHTNSSGALWKGDVPVERHYDKAVNDIFTKIISADFYRELYDRYKEAKIIK